MTTLEYVAVVLLLVSGSSTQSTFDITNMRLKKLLDTSYNKEHAPVTVEGQPVEVVISLHLNELTLHEVDMIMSLRSVDVTQSWTDPRLAAVTHEASDLELFKSQVDQVWKPEVYASNGHRQLTGDRISLTVSRSGHASLQQRLSVDIFCPNFTNHMNPLVCSVHFQPYRFTREVMKYQWGSVTADSQLIIPKYSIVSMETGPCPQSGSQGRYSCQQLVVSFQGHVNFFAAEVYAASLLLVALSWTGFWMKTDDPLYRLCLGLIIVLILVVYNVGFRLLYPKVGVPGSVEVWVAFCTLFVLASLTEYVFVHILLSAIPVQLRRICHNRHTRTSPSAERPYYRNDVILSSQTVEIERTSYLKAARVVDVACGILFPVIFILFNVAYWMTY